MSRFLQTIKLTAIDNEECRTKMEGILSVHDCHLCTFTREGEGICKVSLFKVKLVTVNCKHKIQNYLECFTSSRKTFQTLYEIFEKKLED